MLPISTPIPAQTAAVRQAANELSLPIVFNLWFLMSCGIWQACVLIERP